LHTIQNPATLGWVPVVQVEHYHIEPAKILTAKTEPGSQDAKPAWSLRSPPADQGRTFDF
jgi:hypothetical protein